MLILMIEVQLLNLVGFGGVAQEEHAVAQFHWDIVDTAFAKPSNIRVEDCRKIVCVDESLYRIINRELVLSLTVGILALVVMKVSAELVFETPVVAYYLLRNM